MIGIPPGSAVNDMSSAIIMLSHITGEAITDTLGQFNRYIGLIPNMSQASEAMTEVMEGLIYFKNMRILPMQIRRVG